MDGSYDPESPNHYHTLSHKFTALKITHILHPQFFPNFSRRVPVLRLGSRGPGGDARSLRLCSPSVRKRPQASASVGECRASSGVANRRETQNCRHFYAKLSKSVTSHRDRGGRGRETQNCRHFWTRLVSSRLNSVNNHRDRGGRGREMQNCRHFWTRLGREHRREEKREMRGEKRGERREEKRRVDEERREERGQERG